MKFIELKRHLKERKFYPCYLISGEDAGVRNLARKLFEGIVSDYPELNVSSFETKADAAEIVASCEGIPFASDYRVVFVRDCSFGSERLEAYLHSPNPATVLVLECESVGNNLKRIQQKAESVDCARLDEAFLCGYVATMAARNGVSVTKNAARLLVEYSDRFLSKIDSSLAKLSSVYDLIDETAIRENVNPDVEVATFELVKVIVAKDRKKTTEYLDKMLRDGVSPFAALSMLYSQFRKMFYVAINKDSDTLASDLGVKEYAIRYLLADASRYSPRSLKKICDLIAEADYAVKSGAMTDKIALYSCALQILEV